MTILSWKAIKPYTYLAGNSRKYAIIQYEMEESISGRKMKQTGFQLGIKAPGSSWQFVNGDQITSTIMDQFFPDFPKDAELPVMQQNWE